MACIGSTASVTGSAPAARGVGGDPSRKAKRAEPSLYPHVKRIFAFERTPMVGSPLNGQRPTASHARSQRGCARVVRTELASSPHTRPRALAPFASADSSPPLLPPQEAYHEYQDELKRLAVERSTLRIQSGARGMRGRREAAGLRAHRARIVTIQKIARARLSRKRIARLQVERKIAALMARAERRAVLLVEVRASRPRGARRRARHRTGGPNRPPRRPPPPRRAAARPPRLTSPSRPYLPLLPPRARPARLPQVAGAPDALRGREAAGALCGPAGAAPAQG